MNYRHAFHAGNFADVVKHVTLIALVEAFQRKEAPFCYLETHAGAGSYDLSGEAQRTGEFREGVQKLIDATSLPPLVSRYVKIVEADNRDVPANELRYYPGSPLIAARLMRPDDRLVLCELADEPAAALKALFATDPRVGVHKRDGYEGLRALLPPTPRRGLVLIDPPYEAQEKELKTVAGAVREALTRWATGTYAIWYPIKLRQHIAPFHRFLRECGAPRVLVAELCLKPDNSALRLNGCGLAILNAPWQLDDALRPAFRALHERLAAPGEGVQRVEWLVG